MTYLGVRNDPHRVPVGLESRRQLKAVAGVYGMVLAPEKEQRRGVARSDVMNRLSIDQMAG